MELEFSRQLLEEYSNIMLYENPANGSPVLPYGRTDGQTGRNDAAKSRFSQFG